MTQKTINKGQMLPHALELADIGWFIHPCDPKTKGSLVPAWQENASIDPVKIEKWWSEYPKAMIGVACGLSQLTCLDIDTNQGKGKDGFETWTQIKKDDLFTVQQVTRSGGWQFIFRADPARPLKQGESVNGHSGIDIRNHKGYFIAAPSVCTKDDGYTKQPYSWVPNQDPRSLEPTLPPEWIYDLFSDKDEQDFKPTFKLPEGDIPIGQQDSTLYAYTCSMMAMDKPEDEIVVALRETIAKKCPQNPRSPFKNKDIARWIASAKAFLKKQEENKHERVSIPDAFNDHLKVEMVTKILNKECRFFRDLCGRTVYVDKFMKSIREVSIPMMATEIARNVRFTHQTAKGEIERKSTAFFTSQVMASDMLNLRPLESVTDVPRFMADGSLLDKEGYNARNASFYIKSTNIKRIEFSKAKEIIEDFLFDFAFAYPKDKANILSLLFSPPMMHIIPNFPLHAISANQARTGKSLLAECIMLIYGHTGVTDWSKNEDELKKKVTSMLVSGPMFLCFDNVKSTLQNSAVEGCLTSGRFQDRILGKTEMVNLPAHAIWVATGNGLKFGTEMIMRSICCEMNAHDHSPETRSGFRHPQIKIWTQQNREMLLGAIYSVISEWFRVGAPKFDGPPMGGFETYAETIGGLIQFLGFDGFLDKPMDSIEDTEEAQWLWLLDAWWAEFKSQTCTASDLLSVFEDENSPFNMKNLYDETQKAQRIGYYLKLGSQKNFKDFTIEREKRHAGKHFYKLLQKDGCPF